MSKNPTFVLKQNAIMLFNVLTAAVRHCDGCVMLLLLMNTCDKQSKYSWTIQQDNITTTGQPVVQQNKDKGNLRVASSNISNDLKPAENFWFGQKQVISAGKSCSIPGFLQLC